MNQNAKPILKLDVDGVLRDVISRVLIIYKREYNPQSTLQYEDITKFDFSEFMPEVDNLLNTFFKTTHAEEVFSEGKLYSPEIPQLISELQKKYFIHICSQQYPGNEIYTEEFLKINNIPYDDITFTNEKYEVESDIFIDDHIKFLEEDQSAEIICINQPWNLQESWSGTREEDFVVAAKKLLER